MHRLYFTCWSVSFWPQILKNHARKSVEGLSYDFQVYNLLGFACYSIFNCTLFFSKEVQVGVITVPVYIIVLQHIMFL